MTSWRSSAVLPRHHRVWLTSAIDRADVGGVPEHERLIRWARAGRALVVRRRDASVGDRMVALGVALPIAEARARIAVAVDRSTIVRSAPPLGLADVRVRAPVHRRAALDALERAGASLDTRFAVYGSYAWQAMTGEPYVTDRSDLDLLWNARDSDHVRRVVALLAAWEREHGLRADGEAHFADGAAVAWRELAAAPGRVLVKRNDGVALEPSPLAGS